MTADTVDDRVMIVADAIDEARFAHPTHPRLRDRPFAKADESEREYCTRLARAALAAVSALHRVNWQPFETMALDQYIWIGNIHGEVYVGYETSAGDNAQDVRNSRKHGYYWAPMTKPAPPVIAEHREVK